MAEMNVKIKTISSMEKIFPNVEPTEVENFNSMLQNETLNFQVAICNADWERNKKNKIVVKGELAKYVTMRTVELMPGTYFGGGKDDYYLSQTIGVFPELLKEFDALGLVLPSGCWRAVWVSVTKPEAMPAGEYTLEFDVLSEQDELMASTSYTVEIIAAKSEPCSIHLTNWMHYDCIANYHKAKPFGKRFYAIFEEYLKAYTDIGFNTLLTPLFTPPLDTQVGGERLTTQLVKVKKTANGYEFDFSEVKKFIRFVMKRGIRVIEFSHLFTQWGGKCCPKIVADVNGEEKRIFGWDTPSDSPEYVAFLGEFLPALVKVVNELGLRDKCYFHLTDEPHEEHIPQYEKCREIVKKHIGDLPTFDALSDYSFYERGLVDVPVTITSSYESFAEHNVENLFAYYCCGPSGEYYSNRLMSMPSQRTRVIGLQLYQTKVKGFLHWGYNFYNTVFSLCTVNPYAVTDAGGLFPSGDSYIVYPTEKGVAYSVRAESMREAFQDYAALQLLASKIGEEKVQALLSEFGVKGYKEYPRSAKAHADFKRKINALIKENA